MARPDTSYRPARRRPVSQHSPHTNAHTLTPPGLPQPSPLDHSPHPRQDTHNPNHDRDSQAIPRRFGGGAPPRRQ
jgi:hypothetical protein